jgi:DNA-binding MarR family transcriptional regulator
MPAATSSRKVTAGQIAALRRFNRLYTARLGLLNAHLDGSPFTLTEARVLYELAHGDGLAAADVARTLNVDRAQLSRTLKALGRRLVSGKADPGHGRRQLLRLTAAGRTAFAGLEAKTRQAIGGLLCGLHPLAAGRLLSAASSVSAVLESGPLPEVRLRGLRPGDLGLVTARQALLYSREYGWNQEYEALVAEILAKFQRSFDPAGDDAWIAECGGEMVGSIFLVRGERPKVAKLRLLYVEPEARGMGVGKRLVATCIERARALGHVRLELWTNSVLAAARGIYLRAGFELVEERAHRSFGHELVGQTWALELGR